MNVEALFATRPDEQVRYALSGANGGFGRTLIAQTRYTPRVQPRVLLDRDIPGLLAMCHELGLPADQLHVCKTLDEVSQVSARDGIALIASADLLGAGDWNILVEATGSPSAGYAIARDAIERGKHVAMVSKEVDSVAGAALALLAEQQGVVYTAANGDQPSNLIELVAWAKTLGLEIIAAGKSTEYDLNFDPATGLVRQLDATVKAPELADLLELGDDIQSTLAARASAISELPTGATADYCEMSVVSNATAMLPDVEAMHYPVARIDELADIYASRADGGIVNQAPAVDVFSALRLPGEPSFAGGVFVVVKTHDPETWEAIRGEGHVVSKDGRYACIYLPYHLMGVETSISLLTAVLFNVPTGGLHPRQYVTLAGRAEADIPAGTVLQMGGHHHDVAGVKPVLVPATPENANVAPIYLASFSETTKRIAKGELISIDDIQGYDVDLLAAYQSSYGIR